MRKKKKKKKKVGNPRYYLDVTQDLARSERVGPPLGWSFFLEEGRVCSLFVLLFVWIFCHEMRNRTILSETKSERDVPRERVVCERELIGFHGSSMGSVNAVTFGKTHSWERRLNQKPHVLWYRAGPDNLN